MLRVRCENLRLRVQIDLFLPFVEVVSVVVPQIDFK